MNKIAIVIPVYNDWKSFAALLRAINGQSEALLAEIDVIAIDDGSVASIPPDMPALEHIGSVSIVHLACNLGHQRAIAIGLAHAHRLGAHDLVIVMDSDGEDRPEELLDFIRVHRETPDAIIVGKRAERSEGAAFRGFYMVYKAVFGAMTGQKIDFGNFCLIPRRHLTRIVHMPELWNHLAATVLRAKVPVRRIGTKRGTRYAGKSSMNFISLVVHGLSAMAAFSDVLFVRLLVGSLGIVAFGGLIAVGATGLRLFTGLAIPGWATTAIGVALMVILQGLTLSTTAAFMTLGDRTNLHFVPALNGLSFIREIHRLQDNVE